MSITFLNIIKTLLALYELIQIRAVLFVNSVQIILSLLQDKGLKQKDLANHLGVNQSAIADWKKGKTKSYMRYLPQIAEFLNVPIDSIVDKSEIYSYLSKAESPVNLEYIQSDNVSLNKDNEYNSLRFYVNSNNDVMAENLESNLIFPVEIQNLYNSLSLRAKLEVQTFIIDKSEEEKEKNK